MGSDGAAITQVTLEDGWTALRDGRWHDAKDSFNRAVAHDPSPEAFEGLSWASWWLDDADGVFESRERAFRAYRDAADPAGAARMAIWLAADHVDFNGAIATASGWLERAQRLLAAVPASAEHGWLAFHQGYLAAMRGRASEAEKLGVLAARLGREVEVADVEMLGLALQGMSLVGRAEVGDGMRCLDEASAIALGGEASIPISSAWTCCFMVTACTRVLDFERAFEWCDRIAEFAERYGSRYMLGFCRAEYATILLWRGQWTEAEQALNESLEAFGASRPAMMGGPRVGLAELRRRQGRADDCRRLLDQAGPSRAAQLCRARLALDDDDARAALELIERVDRNVSSERPVDRIPALELMLHAQTALGALEGASATRERLAALTQRVATAGLAAKLCLADGMLDIARGRPEMARPHLEDALDGFEQCGAKFDAACARVELATALRAMGRETDAQEQARCANQELLELGAVVAAARARQLLDGAGPAEAPPTARVSRRELQVLGLVTEGMTNRAIAERLCISEHTVHRHVTSILRKLDVPTRTAAAALALRRGLVDRE